MSLSLRLIAAVRAVQVATALGGLRLGKPVAAAVSAFVPARDAADLYRKVERAAAAGRRPPACLPRALTVHAVLRRHGVDADLKIGVRQGGGGIEAHAWVEVSGHPVGEDEGVGFAALPPLG